MLMPQHTLLLFLQQLLHQHGQIIIFNISAQLSNQQQNQVIILK